LGSQHKPLKDVRCRGKSGKHAVKSSGKKGKTCRKVVGEKRENMPLSRRAGKKKETCKKVIAQEKRKKRKKFNI